MKPTFKLTSGFSLLEVVFALGISAILSLILFQALAQGNKILSKVTTISGHERAVTTLEYIFEREFSGVFIPHIPWKERQLEQNGDDTNPEKQVENKQEKNDQPKEKGEEKNEIPQSFVYERDEAGNLKMFTFITSNTLAVYGEPQVRMNRVMYRLEADPKKEGTFLLIHQQSENLDPKRFEIGTHNGVRAYQILGGIKTLTFEFLIDKPEEKKEDKNKNNPDQKTGDKKTNGSESVTKKIREFETLTEWKEEPKEQEKTPKNSEKNSQEQQKKSQKKRPDLPVFIRITLVLLDSANRPHTYQYWYAPNYDMQPFCSKKITDIAGRQDNQTIFEERQQFLRDTGGMMQ